MGNFDTNLGKILLVGDVSRVFPEAAAVRQLPCIVCADILDAIDAANKNNFAVIAVVMTGLCSKLDSALRTLRDLNTEAKIVLLAQMYEEPLAMQLVGSASDGVRMADDYLICPIQAARFYEAIMSPHGRQPAQIAAPPTVDVNREMRIKELEKLATEDDLTGLKNRRYIWEFAKQIIERAAEEKRRVTLLLFDIDDLKSYNDAYGHLAGDEILKQVGVLMCRCCRQHDVVGRIGGDEFAVVFWEGPRAGHVGPETERRSAAAEHPKEVIYIAKRFQRELEKAQLPLLGPEGRGVLTISGGLASFPRDGSTAEQVFQQADKALLEAKRGGKNKIYLVGKSESDIADIE